MRGLEGQTKDFINKRETSRRTVSHLYRFVAGGDIDPLFQQQAAIEKAWKNKVAHESAVNKVGLLVPMTPVTLADRCAQARAKYESDCININTLNAQASVSQGKEYDKVRTRFCSVNVE